MLTYKFVLYTLLAVVVTFLVHEFSHWAMGEILGYEMRMTLNTGYPLSGKYDREWHYPFISATGPLITLLQAAIFYLLIRRYHNANLAPFVFTCFCVELLSTLFSFRHPNDLARISSYLGIGLFTLPILFTIAHFVLVYRISMKEKYKWKFLATMVVLIIIFTFMWTGTNKIYKVVLL